jgi:hypothetical protein
MPTPSAPRGKAMADLHLALKGIYFDQIRAGTKAEEYRLVTPYWRKRLVGRDYDLLVLTLGYPRSDDDSRRLVLPYRGYSMQTITHEHFGPGPVDVFAINVQALPGEQWEPSNGTVGYSFVADVCGDCQRDADEDCPILARSFRGEAVEWRRTDDDGCYCMFYQPLGEPAPATTCAHTLPLDLEGHRPQEGNGHG